jgi:DnaJ-class molecular chaperone
MTKRSEQPDICQSCNGTGTVWVVPEGRNPFHMGIKAVARQSRQRPCFQCGGSGLRNRLND